MSSIEDIILNNHDNICTGFTGSMNFHKRTSCASSFVSYLFVIMAPVVATDPCVTLVIHGLHYRFIGDIGFITRWIWGSSRVGALPPVPRG